MKKYNIGVSILLIALSLGMIRAASAYDQQAVLGTAMGSGVWPILLGVLLIILSVILIVQTLTKKSPGDDVSPIDFKSPGMKRIYCLIGMLLVFAVLLKLFGFYVSVAFLVPAVMLLLGERRPWMLAALTVGILAFLYVIFVMLLGIKLPVGSLLR